jgi:disease resistance protein RPM1
VLKNLQNVNQITIGKCALQSIQGLYVVALPSLDKVPQGIECLTTLNNLWLLYLHSDFGGTRMDEQQDGSCSKGQSLGVAN